MLIAIVLSLLFVVGVAIAVLPPDDAPTITMNTVDVRRLGIRFVGACGVGLLVLVVSGWVLSGVVVGAGAGDDILVGSDGSGLGASDGSDQVLLVF